jgi:transposase
MFVRKKRNKSGKISIQVIDKSTGSYKLVKTIGSSSDPDTIEKLYAEGVKWIKNYTGQLTLGFSQNKYAKEVAKSIKSVKAIGIELLVTKIYNEIGFNRINSDILRLLTISRIANPVSKLRTIDYLKNYHNIQLGKDQIYRYLDKLHKDQKEQIQQISYKHTLKVLGGVINIVFYDVTTLYFQIDDEDEIRKRGFSKEGRHQNPQIVLGLLVSVDGYPLAFDIFKGNKFEGHTMLPVIDSFKQKYNLQKLVVIADSGLLSNKNIEELQQKGYEFILGARIKNESQAVKQEILSLNLENGESRIIEKQDGLKLIISYSEKRAQKDRHNRKRGLEKLNKLLKSGKLTKASINNRGYNKYLKMEGNVEISIDKEKYEADALWDGLKGYLTNTSLSNEEIIENYGHLWKIEKAFRISKHDLKVRPIYHRLQRRIEAHITINFIAYKVYKELERQLKEKKSDLSPEKVIGIAKTIFQIEIKNPYNGMKEKVNLILNDDQKYVAELFGL